MKICYKTNVCKYIFVTDKVQQEVHCHDLVDYSYCVSSAREDDRSRMQGTTVGHKTEDHNQRHYKIRVIKTRHTVTRMKRHMKAYPVSAADYLRNEALNAD